MKILYHKNFIKSYKKLNIKIRNKFKEKLKKFMENPFSTELNNHSLKGKMLSYRTINITGDYRAIFIEKSNNTYEFVEFYDIGTHSQLYK